MALSTIANWSRPAVSQIARSAWSAVVENIVTTAYCFLYNRMLPADSEVELKRLQAALPQITAVMGIAEALKMKHPPASKWVEQFREALEASEDLLHELEYKRIENMAEQSNEASGSASSSKKQKFNPVTDDTLERLREAVRMLDRAAASVGSLLQLATVLGVHGFSESWQEFGKSLKRETTSFLTEREVFGREVEKGKIVAWLKQPTQSKLSSFGIIGVGGQGKTTLAQFAYQEFGGSNHFDKRIWVCVSINFSVEDVARKILCELGESCLDGKSLNALQECLKEKTLSKKILLILDDIWDDENRRGWEQLIAPLRFVGEGSKILFTTRMKSVGDVLASVINTEYQSLPLDGLREQHLRLLFYSYAFMGVNPDNQREFNKIGDQMLKMLRGSPLAAKVIGSLLNSCMDHHYWRRILHHGSLFNIDQAKDVVEVLKLSYYHLPVDLQVCFRFCSSFPQDFVFEKDSLIKMWMAIGFIPQQLCDEKRPEDVGEDYFNNLLRKSFFEHYKPQEGAYVMHDLVHELAQNISNGECCRVQPNDKLLVIPNSVRHISVHISEIERITHLDNLHTLVITGSFHTSKPDPFLSMKLIKKSLRLLSIASYHCYQLPNEISCLVHLRYLSINIGYNHYLCKCWLSTSIHKLYNLQILEFQGTHKGSSYFGIEQNRMNNLVGLRYVRFPMEIMRTIIGVHKMTSLQELTFYVGKESGHRINELHALNNLRKLFICDIENVGDPAEANSVNLLGKKNLTSLYLKWTSESNPNDPEQIIDNLQPNPDLVSLTIEHYEGLRSPRWMEDSSTLYLSSLKVLNCPKLKGQLFSCQMPYLKLLQVCECPELEELPDMPLSLTEFQVENVGLTSLPNLCHNSDNNTSVIVLQKSSLKIVKIYRCPKLISFHGFLQQDDVDLHVIETLSIRDCENLKYMPTQRFENLTSLKYLSIIDCPNLTRFPYMPHSLTSLELINVAVDSLPEYNTASDSISGPSTTSLKLSLREVIIFNCPELVSLNNGFLQKRHIDFQSIKYMHLIGCRNLVQLPIGAFGKFLSLEDLIVADCPMLVAVNNQSNLLPSTLKSLMFQNCGELDAELMDSASYLTSLRTLCINNCAGITHIPCSESAFRSLNKLVIRNCDKLVEHSSREPAQGINLHSSNLASLKVNVLCIDHLSLLLVEPLRSLKRVNELKIWNSSGMDAFPEEWLQANNNTLRSLTFQKATLKSLPAAIARFTTLEDLKIYECVLLEEIQELPDSLRTLKMYNAKSLKSLPTTITSLTALEEVRIYDADSLKELPEFPRSLKVKIIQRSDGTRL